MDNPKGKKPFEVSKSCAVKKKGSYDDISPSKGSQTVKTMSPSLKEKGVAKEPNSDSEFDEDWLHYLNSEEKFHSQEV